MFEPNQNFEESDSIKDIDDATDDVDSSSDVVEFTDSVVENKTEGTDLRFGENKGAQTTTARKMLEEYREERALRKAIYDDLYGFDEAED